MYHRKNGSISHITKYPFRGPIEAYSLFLLDGTEIVYESGRVYALDVMLKVSLEEYLAAAYRVAGFSVIMKFIKQCTLFMK